MYKGIPRPAIFLPIGQPGSGKSVFLDICVELVGNQNKCSVPPNKFGEPTTASKMYNKLLNICGEINPKSFEKCIDMIKMVSSGDLIDGKFLYQDPFDFNPYCKCFFAANDFPEFIDDTHALYDRIYVIPFTQRFRGTENEVLDYAEVVKPELPAIFNWALKGLVRLKENNFTFSVPEFVEQEKEEYKRINDPVHHFVTVCLKKDNGKILAKDMKMVYDEFVRINYTDEADAKISPKKFGIKMSAKGIYKEKHGNIFFMKVAFSPEAEDYMDILNLEQS